MPTTTLINDERCRQEKKTYRRRFFYFKIFKAKLFFSAFIFSAEIRVVLNSCVCTLTENSFMRRGEENFETNYAQSTLWIQKFKTLNEFQYSSTIGFDRASRKVVFKIWINNEFPLFIFEEEIRYFPIWNKRMSW